ncbi:helix-turn-helix transcriptional regulator [Aquitalea magnusonii]|uniref:LuxR family transcriptional regulator n=1 Tax=Aquitalea magnusonii TaxID=332411 RepID=A0A318JHN2_9NEIS|nr:helix-turn-helix transcriptional regulator [Aquitalea magnusonii]PXX49181.1 LuxR family transcriptional regulator [Aquitalea magnusonii]
MHTLVASAAAEQQLQRSLDVLHDLLPLSACAFYRVNRQQQPHDFLLRSMPDAVHQRYVSRYMQHDPLHPARLAVQPRNVVALREVLAAPMQPASRYAPFLASSRVVDVVEILLRRGGRVVAGISLLRQGRMHGFAAEELQLLQQVYSLLDMALEPCLQSGYPSRTPVPLTGREAEIARLLCAGACNKSMARALDIGLATVKTHLLHLFRKFAVSNRTELACALFAQQQAAAPGPASQDSAGSHP